MKYHLKIENRVFEVEIENIFARPVIALVDGVRFEVWPQTELVSGAPAPTVPAVASTPPVPVATAGAQVQPAVQRISDNQAGQKVIKAPIPGVIISIAVQSGANVSAGQEICILEAMKMKNVIRAAQDGTVSEVRVHVGQHVKHHDPLVELM